MVHCYIVEDSLDRMRALLVTADLNKIFPDQVQDAEALVHRAIGKELLEKVVAVLVDHDC